MLVLLARARALQNDIKQVYKKVEEGADVNFVFGRAYKCPEGYTPLMVACHRGRWGGAAGGEQGAGGSVGDWAGSVSLDAQSGDSSVLPPAHTLN